MFAVELECIIRLDRRRRNPSMVTITASLIRHIKAFVAASKRVTGAVRVTLLKGLIACTQISVTAA